MITGMKIKNKMTKEGSTKIMNIKENAKINKIKMSASVGRKYFEIQIDDTSERMYLMEVNGFILSRVFVVNSEKKLIKISEDNLVYLESIHDTTCDVTYDVRTFGENQRRVVIRDIFLILDDIDYKYIAEQEA